MDALALRLDARYPEFEALERKLKENPVSHLLGVAASFEGAGRLNARTP
jgi:hypothetical protein